MDDDYAVTMTIGMMMSKRRRGIYIFHEDEEAENKEYEEDEEADSAKRDEDEPWMSLMAVMAGGSPPGDGTPW